MAIIFDDLTSAMNSLLQEIPGLVAPSISGLRSEIDITVTAALAEVRQQSATTAQQVSCAVDEQLQKTATGFTSEQERLNNIRRAEHDRLIQVLEMNLQLLDQLSIEVKATVEKVATVGDGKLDEVTTAIIEQRDTMEAYKIDQKMKVDVIHEILSKEVHSMHGSITEVNTRTLAQMDHLERAVGAEMQRRPASASSSTAPGGARGYQICIPDPKSWNLTILKNGESGFLPWSNLGGT